MSSKLTPLLDWHDIVKDIAPAAVLKPLRYERGYVYLEAASTAMRDWMDYKFSGDLMDICRRYDPSVTRVVIVA